MKPIYEPKGKAKEYGDYALNIYTGCPHRCYYCFAPTVLHKDRNAFHTNVAPRGNILEETNTNPFIIWIEERTRVDYGSYSRCTGNSLPGQLLSVSS